MENNNPVYSYLQNCAPLKPAALLLRDPAIAYGLIATCQTTMMFLSGYHDQLSLGLSSDQNWLRMMQGAAATMNVALTTALTAYGRYQTYTDLRDYQGGTPAVEIIERANPQSKTAMGRLLDKALSNSFNINAAVSIPLCFLMLASGIVSRTYGEAATALLLLWAYREQLKPERYGTGEKTNNHVVENAGALRKIFAPVAKPFEKLLSAPPLVVSSVIACWRLIPMTVHAAVKGDIYQTSQGLLGFSMYGFKANTTKDGVGRHKGSIISPDTESSLEITKILLEGRFFRFGRKPE